MRRKKSVVTSRAVAARSPKRGTDRPGTRTHRAAPSSAPSMRSGGGTARATGTRAAPHAQAAPEPGTIAASDAAVDLTVDLAPRRPGALVLRNPLMAAAGCFGYGADSGDLVDVEELGAICTRSTTFEARPGNQPPRMVAIPAGLLNAVGLQNPGVDAVLERYAPRWAAWSVPVIVSVAAGSVDGFASVARRLDGQPGVAAIELNLSCPNVARRGIPFGLDEDDAGDVVAAVRGVTDLPLIAKLSPAAPDPRSVAAAVAASGADAVSAVNTLPGLALDRESRATALGNAYGGISGPALHPVALRVVYEIAQVARIPIIGVGGVTSLADVLDFLLAGASAVGIGTALFADPGLPVRLAAELAEYCRAHGLHSHRELVGAALPTGRGRPGARGAEYRP